MIKTLFLLLAAILPLSCMQKDNTGGGTATRQTTNTWQQKFDGTLPLLGHRNWVLVVDKAFPAQTAPGMEVVNTGEDMAPVLQYVLDAIDSSTHVRPTIYRDKEWTYITEDQVKGTDALKASTAKILNGKEIQTILHDSVFTKLDEASRLFKVLVLKTNAVIPYSSVFLQLDCAYWNAEQEKALRERMK
jgi:hypothetical protein